LGVIQYDEETILVFGGRKPGNTNAGSFLYNVKSDEFKKIGDVFGSEFFNTQPKLYEKTTGCVFTVSNTNAVYKFDNEKKWSKLSQLKN